MTKLVDETSINTIRFIDLNMGTYFISNNNLYHRSQHCSSNAARHVISGETFSFISDAPVIVVTITAIHYKTVK